MDAVDQGPHISAAPAPEFALPQTRTIFEEREWRKGYFPNYTKVG
jgi:hypothetical protein